MVWGVAFPALGRRRADRFPARERSAAAGESAGVVGGGATASEVPDVDDGVELGSWHLRQGYTYLGYR
jgi:hypothetical protein